MNRKKIPVSVMLPEEIDQKLRRLAWESHRTRSAYIRQILRKYVQYMETKDNPNAKPMNWDIDYWMYSALPGVSEGHEDR